MAVRTGEIFNYIVFGDVDSRDYGVYVTAVSVFGSPVRSVETVTVPGRNGDVLLDMGRYENVSVEYKAGIFGDDMSEFASNLSAFRNAIASLQGYQRLEDSYNPEEFRLAAFVSGIDVDTSGGNVSGEFSIAFNAKPQRFLLSGEEVITVTNGTIITNPTKFEASPLLKLSGGHGVLSFNDYTIRLTNSPFGEVSIFNDSQITNWGGFFVYDSEALNEGTLNSGVLNYGDEIYTAKSVQSDLFARHSMNLVLKTGTISAVNATVDNAFFSVASSIASAGSTISVKTDFGQGLNWTEGTSWTQSAVVSVEAVASETISISFPITVSYQAGSETFSIARGAMTVSGSMWELFRQSNSIEVLRLCPLVGDSTRGPNDGAIIDTELGEVYQDNDGELIDINAYVELGSNLPSLAPGENEFSLDSTLRPVEVTPRWWRV